MENQIKYRFRRMELEQLAMFEENYDKDVKEVQFQTTSPRRSVHPGENGGYPPTKNGDIRSLLCA